MEEENMGRQNMKYFFNYFKQQKKSLGLSETFAWPK